MRRLGTWWNNDDIEVYQIEGRPIALYGWNGEEYLDCFEVAEEIGGRLFKLLQGGLSVRPIYEQRGDDFEIVGYELL